MGIRAVVPTAGLAEVLNVEQVHDDDGRKDGQASEAREPEACVANGGPKAQSIWFKVHVDSVRAILDGGQ